MQRVTLSVDSDSYPKALKGRLAALAPAQIIAWGNLDILQQASLAFFCSVKCPGSLILQTYDLARSLRDAHIGVIGGFHSPMEKDCLALLLRGKQPVIICPARTLKGMRLPKDWKSALDQGRLLLLSPFEEKLRRTTADQAQIRNKFVAAIAAAIFIAHATEGSKSEQLSREVLAWGKPLLTLPSPKNARLIALGATPIAMDNLPEIIKKFPGIDSGLRIAGEDYREA
ncbi:MAG: DNA-processing protein DprA [Desulfobaccales bacterium]